MVRLKLGDGIVSDNTYCWKRVALRTKVEGRGEGGIEGRG